MNRLETHKVDYDSPLKYFDFLTFEDFSIDEDISKEKKQYFEIKQEIQKLELLKIHLDNYKMSLKGILQTLKIIKVEKHDKMINFLFHGFPRCFLDSKLFEFCIIDKSIFESITEEYKDYQIISKFECFIGETNPKDNIKYGEYYILQCYKGEKNCSVLKKLIIDWALFDPSFCAFREMNYLNKTGEKDNVFNDYINDLDYYLNGWLRDYLKHEIYYLKFLVNSLNEAQSENKRFKILNKAVLKKQIKHQKKELNKVFESSKNPFVFDCNKATFYWNKKHLTQYSSNISFENINLMSDIHDNTFTLRNNPFEEQNFNNYKITSLKTIPLDLFSEKPNANRLEETPVISNYLKKLEVDLQRQMVTMNGFIRCQACIKDMRVKDKSKTRSRVMVNILENNCKFKEEIAFENWANDFKVFKTLLMAYVVKFMEEKRFNVESTMNKENKRIDNEWIKFASVKSFENDLITDIIGSENMINKMDSINTLIFDLWKYIL
ncbi:hypothetical protein ACO0R3_000649 [Hanseniaspora guilliermondii]